MITSEQFRNIKAKKPNKYKNVKVVIDGFKFDSQKEGNYYLKFKKSLSEGTITELKMQQKFQLIPKQDGERACYYVADFTYKDHKGILTIIDVKGMKTPIYRLKKKLMLFVHNIKIIEL